VVGTVAVTVTPSGNAAARLIGGAAAMNTLFVLWRASP
jgi:hypothetical protein